MQYSNSQRLAKVAPWGFNLIRYQYPSKLLSTFTFLFTLTIEFEWHNNCCCGQYNNSTLDLGWTVKLAKFTSKNTALFYNGDSAVSLLSCIIHVQCGTRRCTEDNRFELSIWKRNILSLVPAFWLHMDEQKIDCTVAIVKKGSILRCGFREFFGWPQV